MTSNFRGIVKSYLQKAPEPAMAPAYRQHTTSSSKETDPAIAQPVAPQGRPTVDNESSARDVADSVSAHLFSRTKSPFDGENGKQMRSGMELTEEKHRTLKQHHQVNSSKETVRK